jgi:hypothetical protein
MQAQISKWMPSVDLLQTVVIVLLCACALQLTAQTRLPVEDGERATKTEPAVPPQVVRLRVAVSIHAKSWVVESTGEEESDL